MISYWNCEVSWLCATPRKAKISLYNQCCKPKLETKYQIFLLIVQSPITSLISSHLGPYIVLSTLFFNTFNHCHCPLQVIEERPDQTGCHNHTQQQQQTLHFLLVHSLCRVIYMCLCVCVCVCVWFFVCICVCLFVCFFVCLCVCIFVCVFVCFCVCVWLCVFCVCVCVCVYLCVCVCIYVCVCVCVCVKLQFLPHTEEFRRYGRLNS